MPAKRVKAAGMRRLTADSPAGQVPVVPCPMRSRASVSENVTLVWFHGLNGRDARPAIVAEAFTRGS
jgi:hypothetical protein